MSSLQTAYTAEITPLPVLTCQVKRYLKLVVRPWHLDFVLLKFQRMDRGMQGLKPQCGLQVPLKCRCWHRHAFWVIACAGVLLA